MPRVENTGNNVDRWAEDTGEGATTHDLCYKCYRALWDDPHAHDDVLKPQGQGEPQGDKGWMGDVEHPSYDERDSFSGHYECKVCGNELDEFFDSAHGGF